MSDSPLSILIGASIEGIVVVVVRNQSNSDISTSLYCKHNWPGQNFSAGHQNDVFRAQGPHAGDAVVLMQHFLQFK